MNLIARGRRLKRLIRAALGKELYLRPEFDGAKVRYGSLYGGWEILDGRLSADSVIYSFGVGDDVSFDLALIHQYGLTVHAFDPTPRSIEWVKSQTLPEQFVMHPYGLAGFDGDVAFSPPEHSGHVSFTLLDTSRQGAGAVNAPVKRLSTIARELGHEHIDVLKMDIEGAEYDVLVDLEKSSIRPVQILIEFHHRFPGIGVERSRNAVSLLRAMNYRLFWVSDSLEEFGFVLPSGVECA